MQPDQARQYRSIGSQLAQYLRQQGGDLPPAAVLQGVVADLVGSRSELLLPLRELIQRPGFQAVAARASSGTGALQRDALLHELGSTFAPAVITALAEFLNGFLDLPSTPVAAPRSGDRPAAVAPAPAPAWREEPAAPALPTPQRRAAPSRLSGCLPLLAGLSAALVAAGVLLLRLSPLCSAFNLCPAEEHPPASELNPTSFAAAQEAELALRRATTLESYRSALAELEQQLQRLAGIPLTPEQTTQLQQLRASAQQGLRILESEEADQERLKRASALLDAATQAAAETRQEQISSARRELEAIPPRGFAAADAGRLRDALDLLEREGSNAAPPTPQPDAETPAPPSPPPAAPAPVPPPPPG